MTSSASVELGSGESTSSATRWTPYALVAVGVGLLVATRIAIWSNDIGNADVAGILYQADLIRDGGVPYIDSLDVKQPGTFFLVALLFRVFGRSLAVVRVACVAWSMLGGVAVWAAARALYRSPTAAGAAVLLYLAAMGGFDVNYSSWMATPYVAAFACLVVALRDDDARLHLAAGACAAIALVFKGQAVVLAPLFPAVWLWARRDPTQRASIRAWWLWLAGAAMGVTPLVLFYAQHHGVAELFAGLVPIGAAREYTASGTPTSFGLSSAWKIFMRQWTLLPTLTAFAGLGTCAALWPRGAPRMRSKRALPIAPPLPIAPQLLFFAVSVVGCGIGGLRYYVHYFAQYVAALALLGAHPAILGFVRTPYRKLADGPARAIAWGLGCIAIWCGVKQLVDLPRGKATTQERGRSGNARRAGLYIREHAQPNDRVQAWSWSTWPVYFWSTHRAPSPVFKTLGQVTTYNQNGILVKPSQLHWKPGPAADVLLAAFRDHPPAYFVNTGHYFEGSATDPLVESGELADIVKRDYVVAKRFGTISVLVRRDRADPRREPPRDVVDEHETQPSPSDESPME